MARFGRVVATASIVGYGGAAFAASPPAPDAQQEAARLAQLPPIAPHGRLIDHSGRKGKGRASYYAHHFDNRKMADGQRFDPNTNAAASKTLPLGTRRARDQSEERKISDGTRRGSRPMG